MYNLFDKVEIILWVLVLLNTLLFTHSYNFNGLVLIKIISLASSLESQIQQQGAYTSRKLIENSCQLTLLQQTRWLLIRTSLSLNVKDFILLLIVSYRLQSLLFQGRYQLH